MHRYVLPNHQLFLLAEQPPNDMAGLLGLFPRVPAIIRRRAKELLDTIRDAAVVEEVAVAMEVSAPTDSVDDAMVVVVAEQDKGEENLPQVVPPSPEEQLWPKGENLCFDFRNGADCLIRYSFESKEIRDGIDVVS